MDQIVLDVRGGKYLCDRAKLIDSSEYFRSMLTNFSEKFKSEIDIELDPYFNDEILNSFFDYIHQRSFVREHVYPVYLLLKYFQCKEFVMNDFKTKVNRPQAHISVSELVSMYYLSKEADWLIFSKLMDKLVDAKNYMDYYYSFYELSLDDFLGLYNAWIQPLKDLEKTPYLIDIFRLDVRYQKTNDVYLQGISQSEDTPVAVEDIEKFRIRLDHFSYGLFDERFHAEFNWNNIVMAGGSVLACLLQNSVGTDHSDIDFWIYGLDVEASYERAKAMITYFESKFTVPIYYSLIGSVVTLVVPEYRRNIQIIFISYENIYQIISNFDLDYIKCAYDGSNVLCTGDFVNSLRSRCIWTIRSNTLPSRIVKAYKKGYSFKENPLKDFPLKENSLKEQHHTSADEMIKILEVKKSVLVNNNKYYYPESRDLHDPERLKLMIRSIMNSKKVVIGSQELFEILLANISGVNEYMFKGTTDTKSETLKNLQFEEKHTVRSRYGDHGASWRSLHLTNLKKPIRVKKSGIMATNHIIQFQSGEGHIMFDLGDDRVFLRFMQDLDKKIFDELQRSCPEYKYSNEFNITLVKKYQPDNAMEFRIKNDTEIINQDKLIPGSLCNIDFTIRGILHLSGSKYYVIKKLNRVFVTDRMSNKYVDLEFDAPASFN